jgi:hypothetical protein
MSINYLLKVHTCAESVLSNVDLTVIPSELTTTTPENNQLKGLHEKQTNDLLE